MALFQSDNTLLNDQCKLAVCCVACARHLFDRVRKDSRTLCESLCNLRAPYEQELADLLNEQDGLQVLLISFRSHDDASREFLRNACERLAVYRGASVSLHLRLESGTTTGQVQLLGRVA